MSVLFDVLPGMEVPVRGLEHNLARMWQVAAETGGPAPAADDVKATQMNFVVHFGFGTEPEDASAQFQTLLRFSRRYPSRVVVLCPLKEERGEETFRAKIYGECFLGKAKGDTRCVEFVILSYPAAARRFLEDQVSVCLSSDLPMYYWAHRFSTGRRLADYQYLLRSSKRVIFDSTLGPADAANFEWPKPDVVRDLVHARLLPVRQSIGQFLGGFEPARLSEALARVEVAPTAGRKPEALVLMAWIRERLVACGAPADLPGTEVSAGPGVRDGLELRFVYTDEKRFCWMGDLARNHAEFSADFGTGEAKLTTAIHLLAPEAALSEAVFF